MSARRLLALVALALLLSLGAAAWYAAGSERAAALLLRTLATATHGALQYRAAAGPLGGPLRIEGLVYEDAHVRVQVERAELDWNLPALLAGQLRIRELRTGPARLSLKPSSEPREPKPAFTQLPLGLVVQQAQLESFTLVTRPGATPLHFDDIQLAADWIGSEIDINTLALAYAPVGALRLGGQLQLQEQALALRGLRIEGPGTLHLEGVIGYDNRIEARMRWENLRWPLASGQELLSPEGRLQLDGHWQDYAYRLAGQLRAPLAAGVEARGRGSLEMLGVEMLALETLEGRAQARGEMRWLPQLTAKARGTFEGLNPGSLAAAWPGELNGSFSAELSGLQPLAAQLELALRGSQLRGHALDLQARLDSEAQVLRLRQLRLQSGASRLQLQGRLQPPYDLAGTLESAELGELWPGLQGAANAKFRLRGSLEQPSIEASGQARALKYAALAVAEADLQMSLFPRAASSFQLELRNVAAGIGIEQLSLNGTGTAARNRFTLDTRSDVGRIQLGFTGALDMQARRWRGEVDSGRGEPLRLSSWTLEEPAALRLGLDGAALAPLCWRSSTGRACVQGGQDAEESRLAFRLERLVLAYFEPLMPPGWKVSGDISGTGRLLRRAGHVEAETDLRSSSGEISIAGRPVLRYAPGSWLAEETGKGFVSRLQLPLSEGGLYWDALLTPAEDWARRQWSGELRADLSSLQALRLLSPELESVDGRVKGRFRISGSAGAPRLDGGLQLRDGVLRLATPGIELTALTAELDADAGSGLIRLSASASSGGGPLRLRGSANAGNLAGSVQLELEGENFQVAGSTQARIWVSPRLSFKLTKDRADLSGEVAVPRAEITPSSFDQGVGPSGDQVIVGADGEGSEGGLLKIYSSVRLTLGEAVSFSGFGLSTQLAGALQAYDQPGRPTTARGEVRLIGGRYRAYGQDLSIQTGRLIFNGGPVTAPAIDIRAEREVGDEVTVGLYIRGLLDAPEFSLYSTPAMPQDQQLAWLVLGRPLQESGTGAGADRSALSGAALSLGLSGGNFFAQKLQRGLGLDEISIGARPGETSEQAQLTFGKYLSPKLFVSYGIGLFEPGQAFRLLYDIGYGFKLSTESGVESGGDLVYTIEK